MNDKKRFCVVCGKERPKTGWVGQGWNALQAFKPKGYVTWCPEHSTQEQMKKPLEELFA